MSSFGNETTDGVLTPSQTAQSLHIVAVFVTLLASMVGVLSPVVLPLLRPGAILLTVGARWLGSRWGKSSARCRSRRWSSPPTLFGESAGRFLQGAQSNCSGDDLGRWPLSHGGFGEGATCALQCLVRRGPMLLCGRPPLPPVRCPTLSAIYHKSLIIR